MQDDTVFNNKTYKKIYECDYSPSINNKVFFGGLREDSTQKIFFFLDTNKSIIYNPNLNSLTEYLLYDFLLNVGDTLLVKNLQDSIQIVQSIDSVFIANEYRKRWNLIGSNQILREWIEGIGSVHGLFYPLQFMFEDFQLLTCYEDTSIFWSNPDLQGVDCFSVGIEPKMSKSSFSIKAYPNPVSTIINFEFEKTYSHKMLLEIYDVLGQRVYDISIANNENNIKINLEDLKKGIYFYKWTSNNKTIGAGKFIKE